MADTELKAFNLVVQIMIEGGYTPSALTDFLVKGLVNVSKAGVSHQDLRPNPSVVQLQILESLASLYQKHRPKASVRGSERNNQKTEALPAAVSTSIPQAPQSEVGAQLSKKRQGIAKTPPAAVSVVSNPLSAESVPHGKKRKELASEADVEFEEEQANVKWLTHEFATQLNLGNESKGPSPKRLKRNVSVPAKAVSTRQKKITPVRKFRDAGDKAKASQYRNTTPVGNPGDARGPPPPSPLPSSSQQQQQKTPIQLRIREAASAKARARGETIR